MDAIICDLRQRDQRTLESVTDLTTIRQCLNEPLVWHSQYPDLIKYSAWTRHITTLLQTIVPAWSVILEDRTSPERKALDQTLLTAPWTALPTALDCLSDGALLKQSVMTVYVDLLRVLTTGPSLDSFFSDPQKDTILVANALCSIPTKIANVLELDQVSHAWYLDTEYCPKLARRLANHPTSPLTPILLEKLIRQGYLETILPAIYPIALAQVRQEQNDVWVKLWDRLPMTDKVTSAMLSFLRHTLDETTLPRQARHFSLVFLDQERAAPFLLHAIQRPAKGADTLTLRFAVAAALFATSTQKELLEKQLSHASRSILQKTMARLIQIWTDPIFVQRHAFQEHTYTSSALLLIAGYLPREDLQQLLIECPIVAGVSLWFQGSDQATLKLGLAVAETISKLSDDEEMQFKSGILGKETDSYLFSIMDLVKKQDAFLPVEEEEEEDSVQVTLPSDDDESEEEVAELDPDALDDFDAASSSDEESDASDLEPYPMEDESDTEDGDAKAKRVKPRKPVYVVDLLAYMKDQDEPIKLEMALNSAAQVIRQRAGMGTELEESAQGLVNRLVGFPTSIEFEDMEEHLREALVALMVCAPEAAVPHSIDQIFNRNTSKSRVFVLLAAITLAVRELAGWKTLDVNKAIEEATDQTKRIDIKSPTTPVGQVTRVSRRAEVEKKQRENTRRNRLSGLAGRVFFFPLLTGWWQGAYGRKPYWIGNDPRVSERFVMTLNVILHSATNTPDKRSIVRSYLEFALTLRFANVTPQVTQALLMGVDIVVNVNYNGQEGLLVQDYTRELVQIKEWMEEIMERVQADELKQIALTILARLADVSSKAY
ncbi:telomere length regulation protein-domain-containing protein [Syncephalastrum racemosum]|uniref:Telomere length regulation protein-domain-containing protein n=1 Tax=Syncephalastrum racemosum TaxID=13706 RepID=A0A1X2HE72_SYNRA|nr:telomere length regulation protein-domain-containing protein [Syncephalastrum racemosum]